MKKALRRRSKRPVSSFNTDEMEEHSDGYVEFVLEQLEKAKQRSPGKPIRCETDEGKSSSTLPIFCIQTQLN